MWPDSAFATPACSSCCSWYRDFCIHSLPPAALHLQPLHPRQGSICPILHPGSSRQLWGLHSRVPPCQRVALGAWKRWESLNLHLALLMIQNLLQPLATARRPRAGDRAGSTGCSSSLEQQGAGPNLAGTECDNSLAHRMMFYFYPKAFC